MAVSQAVRTYYAQRIFANMGRDKVPANFKPLEGPPDGLATVEGCRGGGKNILEVSVRVEKPGQAGDAGRLKDVRVSCGLCNPAMYVGADVVLDWARGRPLGEVLALDPFRIEALAPFFQRLGGPGRPDDAREKFQYTVVALQNAVRTSLGQKAVPPPPIDGPTDKDWDEPA